ncbi:hypothetical protein M8C21_007955 [Ambrosia artemisiifolia]|uniref:Uncharacterized protein n=1 Tax=Ambrosia artemisiifolia TaxID=4212 RepID=A0AAD5CS75_AMBAR|nr:hypothetical protein M8C21_007955 [Ambrosia artemisiifolia]
MMQGIIFCKSIAHQVCISFFLFVFKTPTASVGSGICIFYTNKGS